MRPFQRFRKDQAGATALEYGLIGALVFLAALGALQAFGAANISVYNKISSNITTATGS